MENKQENNNLQEINYKMVPMSKRLLASLVDFLFSIFTGFILLCLVLLIAERNENYSSLFTKRDEIVIESGLYIKNSEDKTERISSFYDDNNDLTYNEKSNLIDEKLNYYFNLETYFPDKDGVAIYNKAKRSTKDDDKLLFNEDYSRALVNSDYDEAYYNFYCDTVDNVAVSYLTRSEAYYNIAKQIVIIDSIFLIACYLFPIIIFFYIMPLIFRRGHTTLGQKIFKIGIVNFDGLNCKFSKFTLRFLFFFFIEIILSLIAFLIPLIVSFSMLGFSKRRQTLHDYVLNTYAVDISQDDIYLNLSEYENAKENKEKIMIENSDIKLS
ncbi:MAG: RDD family protein [Bacilli bacterium]|jgi:uncharacterized RDD family membrane protein YckC